VTPSSPAHGFLLWAWEEVMGRSMSALAAMVLENSVTQALRDGGVPLVELQAIVLMALDEGLELLVD